MWSAAVFFLLITIFGTMADQSKAHLPDRMERKVIDFFLDFKVSFFFLRRLHFT
jgi:hypothetical protein